MKNIELNDIIMSNNSGSFNFQLNDHYQLYRIILHVLLNVEFRVMVSKGQIKIISIHTPYGDPQYHESLINSLIFLTILKSNTVIEIRTKIYIYCQINRSKAKRLKRTVSVISSDPPFKDCNVQFTTVPLNPLSDH